MSTLDIIGISALWIISAAVIVWFERKRGQTWKHVLLNMVFSNLLAFAAMFAWSYWR